MEIIVVACKSVSAALKDVKAEIYAIQHLAGHRCFSYIYGIMEKGLI